MHEVIILILFQIHFLLLFCQFQSLVLADLLQPPRQSFKVKYLLLLVDDFALHQMKLILVLILLLTFFRGAIRQGIGLIEYAILGNFVVGAQLRQILVLLQLLGLVVNVRVWDQV